MEPIKMSMNLPGKTVETLKRLAKENETTMTDIIKKALSVYDYMNEYHKEGNLIVISVEKDKKRKDVLFLP